METTSYSEARRLMAQKVSDYRKESDSHKANRKEAVCKRCAHFSMDVCNYLIDMNKQRPCAPSMCVKEKVFRPGKRRKVEQITLKP